MCVYFRFEIQVIIILCICACIKKKLYKTNELHEGITSPYIIYITLLSTDITGSHAIRIVYIIYNNMYHDRGYIIVVYT